MMYHNQRVSVTNKNNCIGTANLRAVGPSIDDATLSYVRQVRTTNDAHESQHAFDTFQKAFHEWAPSSIACIKPCDKATLDVIFYHSDRLDMGMPLNQGMLEFQKRIAYLVSEWSERMKQDDCVAFGDLQRLLEAMELSTWDSYLDFYSSRDRVNDRRYMYLVGCVLPSLISMQSLVKGIQLCNDKRQNFLAVSIHGHQYQNIEMLHAYKCFANTDTLMRFQVHDAKALMSMSKSSLEMDLFDISTIYGIGENDQDWLYMCAYFYKYPSLLFGDMNYPKVSSTNSTNTTPSSSGKMAKHEAGHWPNIHTFVKAVAVKRFEIQQLFSDLMSYSNVVTVLQTTLTSDAIIEAEFKVIMNCDRFHITASDVTKFRMVKLLYDFSQPLQNFVETCKRHKFCLANVDETFRSLQLDVVNFYSFPDRHNRSDCIRFFHRLHNIFCPQHAPDIDSEDTRTVSTYIKELHKIDDLTRVLSWLLPLTYVSYGPKVWQYVVLDMKWCGKEGYMNFSQTYEKVRYSLLTIEGNTENGILENIAPVVHLFSIIGKYKDTCSSIQELLQNFQKNESDVLRNYINESSIERYIYEANSRIVAIRELLNCSTSIADDGRVGRPTKTPMLSRSNTVERPSLPMTYGTLADENEMRSWLDAHALPSNVGDLFVSSGIRSMDDVRMLSTLDDHDKNDTISTLAKLDRIKLLNAMKHIVTSDATKKRKSGLFF